MNATQPLVECLGYIGGQDEELGGYCEPLRVRTPDGEEHYVLHKMYTFHPELPVRDPWIPYEQRVDVDKILAKHSKVEFRTLEKLMHAWREVQRHLTINHSLPWQETDAKCGYDLPDEVFKNAQKVEVQ